MGPNATTFDADLFVKLVYAAVELIPEGRVTTYGAIARLIEHPKHSRHVGQALKALPDDTGLPWHRVINSSSCISPRGDNGAGAERQAERLEAEGVRVAQDAMGTWKVDRAAHWDVEGRTLEELLREREGEE